MPVQQVACDRKTEQEALGSVVSSDVGASSFDASLAGVFCRLTIISLSAALADPCMLR